jgi:hypothetical protein
LFETPLVKELKMRLAKYVSSPMNNDELTKFVPRLFEGKLSFVAKIEVVPTDITFPETLRRVEVTATCPGWNDAVHEIFKRDRDWDYKFSNRTETDVHAT